MKKQSELFPTTTSSAEECHVKVGVPQVNKKAQKMTATSGRQCLKLLKAKDPLMLLSRTLMVSSPWEGPISYQMTWKPKATLRRRLLFQLYPQKLPTEGIESGSSGKKSKSDTWATPTTQEIEHPNAELTDTGRRKSKDGKSSHSLNLADQVNMWPTPTSDQPGDGEFLGKLQTKDGKPPQRNQRAYDPKTGKHTQITLNRAVKLWPTPRVSDTEGGVVKNVEKKNDSYSRVNKKGVRFGVKLKDAVGYEEDRTWPTPIVGDAHLSSTKEVAQKRLKEGKVTLSRAVQSETWPTPSSRDYKGGHGTIVEEDGKYYRVSNTTGTKYGARLDAQVEKMEADRTWPTPRSSEWKDTGPVGSKSHTHMDKKGYLCTKTKDPNEPKGALNPDWVEWLMGYAPGYTNPEYTEPMQLEDHLGFESEPDIPRVTTRKEHRVNRLKCLGNSIVPQIMYEIGNAILADYNKEK